MGTAAYWVRRCERCGELESYSVKGPDPGPSTGYCNHCSAVTKGSWLPEGDPDKDWRLTGQDDFLTGITLRRLPYSTPGDHDHCVFCWAKFMAPETSQEGEDAGEPIEHAGYTNEGVAGREDHYWWICDECFVDFAGRFRWTVLPIDDASR